MGLYAGIIRVSGLCGFFACALNWDFVMFMIIRKVDCGNLLVDLYDSFLF